MAAEIPDGAVILARNITNSSLWSMRDEDFRLAIYCICKANWKENRWFDGRKAITIKRGQFVTSIRSLQKESGLSTRSTRTSLKRLEKCGFLTRKTTHHWTLVTLPKYDLYQTLSNYYDTPFDTRPTRDRLTPDTDPTQTRLAGDNKQEGEERKEGEEGGRRDNGASASISHLFKIATRTTEISGREDTIRSYLKGWVRRIGADKVEEVLMDPKAAGLTVTEIQDKFIKRNTKTALDREIEEFTKGEKS